VALPHRVAQVGRTTLGDQAMRRRNGSYNPKRKILPVESLATETRERLGAMASYGGNPEHKTRPGDYGLVPPCNPRPGKTLCDTGRDFRREEALALLREGFETWSNQRPDAQRLAAECLGGERRR